MGSSLSTQDLLKTTQFQNKVVIITGSDNLAKNTAIILLKHGATVIIACKREHKYVVDDIRQATNCIHDSLHYIPLDLTSFLSIHHFVSQFKLMNLPLHVLVNNTFMKPPPEHYECNINRIEIQFMEYYLGPYLLTKLLIPILLKNTPSRVVSLTSQAHCGILENWKFNLKDIPPSINNYEPERNHGLTKLCTTLCMNELTRQYGKDGLIGITCNPGILHSTIDKEDLMMISSITLTKTIQETAASVIYCCFSESIKGGCYYVNNQLTLLPKPATNGLYGVLLWELSEGLVSKYSVMPHGSPKRRRASLSESTNSLINTNSIIFEWQKDKDITNCNLCDIEFTTLIRKHHCRFCGKIICAECSLCKIPDNLRGNGTLSRACNACLKIVYIRGLNNNSYHKSLVY